LGVKLDAESAALALGDVDGVAVAAADLVEDRLAREAGSRGGVGEADVAAGVPPIPPATPYGGARETQSLRLRPISTATTDQP
jgi:hypothetical protein